jgi:hypothetical protein
MCHLKMHSAGKEFRQTAELNSVSRIALPLILAAASTIHPGRGSAADSRHASARAPNQARREAAWRRWAGTDE